MLDLASRGIESFVDMQKRMLDVLVQQSVCMVNPMQCEPVASVETPANVEAEDEAIDTLIAENEDAQIAAKVVDRIAELVQQAESDVEADAAVQQTVEPVKPKKSNSVAPNSKRGNSAKTKNQW